jgi:hypothetical protein
VLGELELAALDEGVDEQRATASDGTLDSARRPA